MAVPAEASSISMPVSRSAKRSVSTGVLLGVGVAGFIDETVFH